MVAADSTSGRRHSFSRRSGGGPNKSSIKMGVLWATVGHDYPGVGGYI